MNEKPKLYDETTLTVAAAAMDREYENALKGIEILKQTAAGRRELTQKYLGDAPSKEGA